VSDARLVSLESLGVGPAGPGEEFSSPSRIHMSLLADRERLLLNRLCHWMPQWVTPDRLTAIGSVGAVVTAAGYVASNLQPEFLFLASFGIIINWFGDSLDGSLARYTGIERPRYGYFIDHSVDGLNNLVFAIGFGLSPYVSMEAALLLLCGYYLLSIQVFLSAQVDREFQLTRAYLGPTELRLMAIAFNFVVYFVGPRTIVLAGSTVSVFSLLVEVEAIVFICIYGYGLYEKSRKLGLQDPIDRMSA
jgi:phosphatidylglycerophosphate synthase